MPPHSIRSHCKHVRVPTTGKAWSTSMSAPEGRHEHRTGRATPLPAAAMRCCTTAKVVSPLTCMHGIDMVQHLHMSCTLLGGVQPTSRCDCSATVSDRTIPLAFTHEPAPLHCRFPTAHIRKGELRAEAARPIAIPLHSQFPYLPRRLRRELLETDKQTVTAKTHQYL